MIDALNRLLLELALNVITLEQWNAFMRDPRATALLVGGLVSVSAASLGVWLVLRRTAMTTDAISHTVLLGIVVAFLVMVVGFNTEADLSSPWLIVGAAVAGIATLFLTDLIQRSGLVKEDAALGLAFPFMFALSIVLISRFIDDAHLDTDSVMVGEIGVVWANTYTYCLNQCDGIEITPTHPLAENGRECINCVEQNISPRSAEAIFREVCSNCGSYTASEAYSMGYVEQPPQVAFIPKAFSAMLVITLLNLAFVTIFYKELQLSSFDPALAKTLGFMPATLNYVLMTLTSLTAVGAFDAVGSVLVVAFFILPAATAYLLTDRLAVMLILSPLIGFLGAVSGYSLARGNVLGVLNLNALFNSLNRAFALNLLEWNTSISASMVMMLFVWFVLAWMGSPKYGLLAVMLRQRRQRDRFSEQLFLAHVLNHTDQPDAQEECRVDHLPQHLNWSQWRVRVTLARLSLARLVTVQEGIVSLTEDGKAYATHFRAQYRLRSL